MRDDGTEGRIEHLPTHVHDAPTPRIGSLDRESGAPPSSTAPHGAAEPGTGEIDLVAVAASLWRGRRRIATSGLLTLGAAVAYLAWVAVPTYTSTAVVALESREQSVAGLDSVLSGLSGEPASVNTEIEVIRSRGLIEALVADLGLASDPEFNPALDGPPLSRAGALWRSARAAASEALPADLIPDDARPMDDAAQFDRTVESVREALSVSNLRQSLVFEITAATHDAGKSARIANTLADLYTEEQIRAKFEATARATEWLGEQVAELREELDVAQDRLLAFTAQTRLVSNEEVIRLNRRIADLRERLAEVGAGEGGRAAAQADALTRTLAELESELDRQSEGFIERQALERGVAQAQLIYDYFETRLRETAVQQNLQEPDARLLSRAVVPPQPAAPQTAVVLAVGLALGVLGGAGITLLREARSTGLRSGEALESVTGRPVLAEIPIVRAKSRTALLDHLAEKPNSRIAESIRNLRVSIAMSNLDAPPQVILSTSSVPAEGKTTQSQALAMSFAAQGRSVLLVECDLRRRTFADTMGLSDEFGLLSVLSDEAMLADAVQRDDRMAGVDVLVADRMGTANPVDVFASSRFGQFVRHARDRYDIVILDAPPVLAVPDARVIATEADATLYTVKWDATPRSAVRDGLRMLDMVGARIAGLVLSQIDPKGAERYGREAYGTYGKGYYADD